MKKILYLIAFLLIGGYAYGEEINPQDALKIANEFRTASFGKARSAKPLQLTHTIAAKQGNALYVFAPENGEGFVLVAGNDVMDPIFGYSDTGRFETENMPENIAFWLDVYRKRVDELTESGAPSNATSFPDDTKPNVEMIMKTTWDQDAPYYNLCPKSYSKYCYTGCVATAMAQVMKVFEWPTTSSGTATWNNTMVTFNRTYAWSNMLNSYSGSYTSAQGTAVAELMVDCGKSVDMSYSTSGSGANTDDVPGAMTNIFKYHPCMAYIQKSAFSAKSWNDLMYNEMAHGRPVLYGGFGPGYNGGHQFVADGYRTTGYYHINWGWSGLCDGYYLIDNLTPSSTGIGGGDYGSYNVGCDAVIGIQPENATSTTWVDRFIFCLGNFNLSASTSTSMTFNTTNGTLWSSSQNGFVALGGNSFKTTLGVRFINVDNPEASITLPSTTSNQSFTKWSTIVTSFKVNTSSLPDGKYYAFPMSKAADTNEWIRMLQHTDKRQYVVITKSGSSITSSAAPTDATQFYPVSWIKLESNNDSVQRGKTLTLQPLVLPADAKNPNLAYSSSDTDVAKVDENGVITGIKEGTAVITLAATDGSGIESLVNIRVTPSSGCNAISLDENTTYDVYNFMGIKVATAITPAEINKLPKGIYIAGGAKIMVK